MKNSPENYSPDERANISKVERSRTLSDAELIRDGASYEVDKTGKKRLELTSGQMESVHKEVKDREWALSDLKNAIWDFDAHPDNPWQGPRRGSTELRKDLDFILSKFNNDKEIVLLIIRNKFLSQLLKYKQISSELRKDKEVSKLLRNRYVKEWFIL